MRVNVDPEKNKSCEIVIKMLTIKQENIGNNVL